ncbi:hypothetical protein IT408_00615 [Candidatus Uhrbacteria bacterium]|nr:hypothetical protein [Candidatus Uhrbacteria bacterium]
MFFPVQAIQELKLYNWHLGCPKPLPQHLQIILDKNEFNYTTDCLRDYLLHLPNPFEIQKILVTLQDEARNLARAELSNFFWWDICPGEHWLFANMQRDSHHLLVSFCWKTVNKGKPAGIFSQTDASWSFDKDAPRCSRFHFHQPEYHALVEVFKRWLLQPMPDWPHWATPTLLTQVFWVFLFTLTGLRHKTLNLLSKIDFFIFML